MGRCIVYTRIRLLLLFHPFISSFFFLSHFQTLKFFVTLFSGTVRPRRLKLGTHVDTGQMYGVYRNKAAAAYSSLLFFIFLSNFQTLKFFVTFLRNCEASRRLELGTHMDNEGMYRMPGSCCCLICPFIFSFFPSFQFSSSKNFCQSFLGNCEA